MAEFRIGQQNIQSDVSGQVQLRGFLYQTKEGSWILSQEPQLKSCCVGAREKVMEQVFLNGNVSGFSSLATVVDVAGVLTINPLYGESGEMIQYYQLQDVVIHKNERVFQAWEWGGWICFVIVMVWLFQRLNGLVHFRET